MDLNSDENELYDIGRRMFLKSTTAFGALTGGLSQIPDLGGASTQGSTISFADLKGKPEGYQYSQASFGVYIWYDDGQYIFKFEGGNASDPICDFSFTTDGEFTGIYHPNQGGRFDWDNWDHAHTTFGETKIEGRCRSGIGNVDGFRFELKNASRLTINVKINGSYNFERVYFGNNKKNPSSFPVTIQPGSSDTPELDLQIENVRPVQVVENTHYPGALGQVSISGAKEAVVSDNGQWAFVATGQGFVSVDVSDPSDPLIKARRTPEMNGIFDVKVDGDRLIAVGPEDGRHDSETKGVALYDVSDPSAPKQLSLYEIDYAIHNAFIEDGYAYIIDNSRDELVIHELAGGDRGELYWRARWGLDDAPGYDSKASQLHDLWVEAGTAYLNLMDDGTAVLDVSNPEQPSFETFVRDGTDRDPEKDHYVMVNDDDSLLAIGKEDMSDSDLGVELWDISEGVNDATFHGEIKPPKGPGERTAHNFDIKGDYLYTAWYEGGIRVHDVSDPENPNEVASYSDNDTSFWTAKVADGTDQRSVVIASDIEQGGLYTFKAPNIGKIDSYDRETIEDRSEIFFDYLEVDQPLVANKLTTIVFDIAGSYNGDGSVVFELQRTLTNGETNTDEVNLSSDLVDAALKDDNTLLGSMPRSSPYPTFTLNPDTEELTVQRKSAPSDASETVNVGEIVQMPELTVGFVGIQGGDNRPYGTLEGGFQPGHYDRFVEEAASRFNRMFPTHRVNVVKAQLDSLTVSESVVREGWKRKIQSIETITKHGVSVREIMQDVLNGKASAVNNTAVFAYENGTQIDTPNESDIDTVHVAIGVVPEDYFPGINKGGAAGYHPTGSPNQPPAAPLVRVDRPQVAQHEAGHHFLGHEPYSAFGGMIGRAGNDDYDWEDEQNEIQEWHASDQLRSTKYILTDHVLRRSLQASSFMSYDYQNPWMDTLAYDMLLDDEDGDPFSPRPSVGSENNNDYCDNNDCDTGSAYVMGRVTADGIEVFEQVVSARGPITDVADTNAIARVYDTDGEVIGTHGFNQGVTLTGAGGDDLTAEHVVFGGVLFPEEATSVEITAPKPGSDASGTVSTTVTPQIDSLREALLSIPDSAIRNNGFIESVSNQLETTTRHIVAQRYDPAANVLQNIDGKVKKHVTPGYDTTPYRVRSKVEIRSMLANRIDRLRQLTD